MIKDINKTQKPKKYNFMDQSILGEAIINFSEIQKSTWFVYQKTDDRIEFLELNTKSLEVAYKIIILFNKIKFNYNKGQQVKGHNLQDLLSKVVKTTTKLSEKDHVVIIDLN